MKTTGVSRRIDDLGRIVIPKEIRKNLKIREGELLEILVENDKIILTKHSSMESIADIARQCVDAVSESTNINMLISDRDKIIAASPALRKKYLDKELSISASDLFLKHGVVSEKEPRGIMLIDDSEETMTCTSYPIIVDGDVAGLVLILGLDQKISETDEKIANVVSKFLSRNIM